MNNNIIKIKVPATSANIGAGFDCLGIALGLYNEFAVLYNGDKGLAIDTESYIPSDEKNIVYTTILYTFSVALKRKKGIKGHIVFQEYLSNKDKPLNIKIIQKSNIPIASGLGSSASCIIAGVIIANKLMGNVFNDNEIVNICAQLDGHPDNVVAAYFGGVTASLISNNEIVYSKIDFCADAKLTVFHPEYHLKTRLSRAILPKSYTSSDVINNIQRAVLTFSALSKGDLSLLKKSVDDRLHEPYRSSIITDFDGIKKNALLCGAYAVYISGAGPCVAAFTDSYFSVEKMNIYLDGLNNKWETLILDIVNQGAIID